VSSDSNYDQAGVGGGHSPMPESNPAPASQEVTIGSDYSSLHDLADAVSTDRASRDAAALQERSVPDVVEYHRPQTETVTPQRAAEDLTRYREHKAQQREEAGIFSDEEKARQPQYQQPQPQHQLPEFHYDPAAIPTRESMAQAEPHVQQALAQTRQQLNQIDQEIANLELAGNDSSHLVQARERVVGNITQPEYLSRVHQAVAQGMEPELAAALSNPKVIHALNEHMNNMNAHYARAIENAHVGTVQASQAAMAALWSHCPELLQVPPEQIQAVMYGIERANLQRAALIRRQMAHSVALMERGMALGAERARTYQQQFNIWAKGQDEEFQRRAPEWRSVEFSRWATHEMARFLTERYEMTAQEMAYSWHTEPKLRNWKSQLGLYDAFKAWRAKQKLPEKKVRQKAAKVMSPGGGDGVWAPPAEPMARSYEGNSGIRAAAEALTARRTRRR
jgi:hypothetical protein